LVPTVGQVAALRVVGIASYGTVKDCTEQAGVFVDPNRFVDWMESESKLNLVPCFSRLFEWNQNPDCVEWTVGETGDLCGATKRFANSCGLPASMPEPAAPPSVWFAHPTPPELSVATAAGQAAVISVEVGATSPVGVREVKVDIFDSTGKLVAGDTSQWEPYDFPAATLVAGKWRIRAEAQDFLGQVSSQEMVLFVGSRAESSGCPSTKSQSASSDKSLLFAFGAVVVLRRRRRRSTLSTAGMDGRL